MSSHLTHYLHFLSLPSPAHPGACILSAVQPLQAAGSIMASSALAYFWNTLATISSAICPPQVALCWKPSIEVALFGTFVSVWCPLLETHRQDHHLHHVVPRGKPCCRRVRVKSKTYRGQFCVFKKISIEFGARAHCQIGSNSNCNILAVNNTTSNREQAGLAGHWAQ